MRKLSLLFAIILLVCACSSKMHPTSNKGDVEVWATDPAAGILFQKKDNAVVASANGNEATIHVDVSKTFQTIDGFGYCLTGGCAFHLYNMNKADRAALLKELFATDGNNIGVSYLRLSIGASDLDAKVFSYNDLPAGETDTAMQKFSIAPDKQFLIPVLKEILAINPSIKILGSPWSPPTWMKTNNNSKGGSLKKEYYNAYSKYFVKYIHAMKAEGITIDAVTVQNEPLHPGNNPSLLMQANEQADFIKQSLGPAFRANNIATKIIVYDHNCDRPDYPVTIYNDKEAAQYVDGAAFHLYAGPIDTLSMLHDAFPAKNLYFTEEWVGAPGDLPVDFKWHTKNVIIGTMRNWCKTALEWNLAANSQWQPHTPGGCTECLGAVTIDGNNVKRNPAYYIIAQASKFVRPGSLRIASDEPKGLANVAFKTTDGKKVLIVLNESEQTQEFSVSDGGKTFKSSLAKGAAATFVW
ncbi:glycoside hydrolase family 30 beta sandwich domain-containing protein [Chitinophagaceae bacterium 26-R-25]|nr:glycoside hydrolase family 30 beta sandwich domain-containing protein [Chitinophagaceae bacterium 26-R-25]